MKFNTSDYLNAIDSQKFGRNILYIPKVKSTNDEMWTHFNNNDHLIIVTDNQTEGRGQRGNKWISNKLESLTFSVGILDDMKNSSLISLKAGLSISYAINNISGLEATIKWPNDILIKNKKISGILIESKIHHKYRVLNIGIGINVNLNLKNIDKNIRDKSTSISHELGKTYERETILAECIKKLEYYLYKSDRFIINEWTNKCAHINKNLAFHDTNDQIIKGKFIGIDKKGRAKILKNEKINYYSNGAINL